jgi:hypothetical protein
MVPLEPVAPLEPMVLLVGKGFVLDSLFMGVLFAG